MKNNYTRKLRSLLLFTSLLIGLTSYAQDINFTFANAQNTNSGGNDYYEVDVMVQTINATGSFKLGSGQLYFTYNTAAFGENINANSSFEVMQEDDYICGQGIDLVSSIKIYGGFTANDNTASRVSWAFSQTFSSSTFAADNVSEVNTKLCHIKIKYTDVSEDAMFMFEAGANYTDQFFTACGLAAAGATGTADCTSEPGIQLVNDSFDNLGGTLLNTDFELLTSLSLYPNPTKGVINLKGNFTAINKIEIFSLSGQLILQIKKNLKGINIENLPSGLYLLKIETEKGIVTKKVIKE
jgi:hypothetical protein